jgi:dipeptidyl aminopeptidase/acylaminoacyl peptidase
MMTRNLAAVLVICIGGAGAVTFSQQPTQGPAILDVRPVTFPAYDQYQGIAAYAPAAADYAQAVGDRAFVMERLTYRSDDLDVYAYLYRPAVPPTDRKLPVVVFNRGSYVRGEFAPEVLMPGNRLAREGFLVIAPMLRGSGGSRGHDEMGGADLHDVFNIVPVIRQIPYADPTRIFLYGQSRGGVMNLLAARDGFPARAIAGWGAFTDMAAYIAVDAGARQAVPVIWPAYAANEAAILESRSAIRWPEKINVPVLLMNGGADRQVLPLHALQLATALQNLGKPYELKIFHGEYHSIAGRARERDDEAIRWFRRFDVPAARP